ncbi:MAG: phenylacetic acid degradation protein PaaN [Bacteroidia bacterium]
MNLFEKHKETLQNAIKAIHERTFFAAFPEHPKAYGEDAPGQGEAQFQQTRNNHFGGLNDKDATGWIGEETSPYTQEKLGVKYPEIDVATLVRNAGKAGKNWRKASPAERAGLLMDSLDKMKDRFFEIGHATQHTTGQSFIMSFQASGPHAADRALEAIALGYHELTRFPENAEWEKPMGKFNVKLKKSWKPVPRGTGLVIGCSTFPVWNSIPGIYASLVTGNPVIVKPHPGAVYPIAIVVACIQQALTDNGLDPDICQLAVDTHGNPVTKKLAEHNNVKLIDYTGGPSFGDYIEKLPGKITFTEKAGVNSVILDSVNSLDPVFQNLSFAISLYSGQMCTAPQNIFIPEGGIKTAEGNLTYEEVVQKLAANIKGLVTHPKMGAGTLGAIQNPATRERVAHAKNLGGHVVLEPEDVQNPEFANALISAPVVVEVDATNKDIFSEERFGPIVLVVKTKDTGHSVELARDLAMEKGAITCGAYTTDAGTREMIAEEMEQAFTPVSFNMVGPIWMNQNAAFSDFHVTGGNPAGNASFTNPEYVNKRFVWVGHREVI